VAVTLLNLIHGSKRRSLRKLIFMVLGKAVPFLP
jgi:hypothetical protein